MIFQVSVFGQLDIPPGKYQKLTDPNLGLVSFLNNIITFITVIAGIWVVFNFISAGYQYLNSNNEPQKITAAGNKILQSVIGLAIVAAAYVIAGILGFILYKDATVLLNPILRSQY